MSRPRPAPPSRARRVVAVVASLFAPGAGHALLGAPGWALAFSLVAPFFTGLALRLGWRGLVIAALLRGVAAVHAARLLTLPGAGPKGARAVMLVAATAAVGLFTQMAGERSGFPPR